jgi:nucleoside-diphosphate-sugar epimerase
LAGLSNDPLGEYDESLTTIINEEASVKLANFAKSNGIKRFIFASSCSIYGASDNTFLDERSPFCPVTPYARSKANVETALSLLADEHFSPTLLRASTAYGASPRHRFDLVVNNLTAWAMTTGEVYLKSDGTPWRPLVHIEDIARAYIAVLESPREIIHNQAFNVGTTSENYRISDIASIVAEIVPKCKIAFSPDAGPDRRCYRVNCNKIASHLENFKPQWTARRGIEQLFELYSHTALKLKDFEGARFNRIDHVKELVARGEIDPDLRRSQNGKNRSDTRESDTRHGHIDFDSPA